ncbi:MAG TPA: hypothetical protein VMF89_25495, partial [Polyangiales bacterium]|nr:hypothetical protein [Polyangiales bacterium]
MSLGGSIVQMVSDCNLTTRWPDCMTMMRKAYGVRLRSATWRTTAMTQRLEPGTRIAPRTLTTLS